MATLKELFGIDKLMKLRELVKNVGGVRAAIKQRYLYVFFITYCNICIIFRMDVTRAGTLVGEDKFGNKYFEDNSYFMPRNRWVVYPEKVWLDYDASQVPPEWHRWLHHIADKPPTIEPPVDHKWILQHTENTSIYVYVLFLEIF